MTPSEDAARWSKLYALKSPFKRQAIFFDRDGVLIFDSGYVGDASSVRVLDGADQALIASHAAGFINVVVTNQSGVGRGYFTWQDFEAVQAAMISQLSGGGIDAVYACAAHESAVREFRSDDHPWRKPNPGMIIAAAEALNLDLHQSWIIGDKESDLEAGLSAGLNGGVLLKEGEPTSFVPGRYAARPDFLFARCPSADIACELIINARKR